MCERIPYPVDERGIPYAPQGIAECYEVCLKGIKTTDRHHLAFERKRYQDSTGRNYRESASMILRACVCKHQDLHATYLPPQRPMSQAMHDVAQGDYEPKEAEVWIRTKAEVNHDNLVA